MRWYNKEDWIQKSLERANKKRAKRMRKIEAVIRKLDGGVDVRPVFDRFLPGWDRDIFK